MWLSSKVVWGQKWTMIPEGSDPLTLPSYFRIKDAHQKALYTRNGQLLLGDPDSDNYSPGDLPVVGVGEWRGGCGGGSLPEVA
jgi:hypothetical protein